MRISGKALALIDLVVCLVCAAAAGVFATLLALSPKLGFPADVLLVGLGGVVGAIIGVAPNLTK